MRLAVRSLIRAACAAADPKAAVERTLELAGSDLLIKSSSGFSAGNLCLKLNEGGRIFVVGAGKASPAMAAGVERVLGARITAGLVVTKTPPGKKGKARSYPKLRRMEIMEAAHPVPNAAGRRAASRILTLLDGLTKNDLILVLISGGASALLPLPAGTLTLRDKQRVTDLLLRSGAVINEINAVRKHLSLIKGGQLARQASPARVVSLILSDVIGNPLEVIGSGPTAPDPTTFQDAVRILKDHGIWSKVPSPVRRHLNVGTRGKRPETAKRRDRFFRRVHNVIIGDNRSAVLAASRKIEAMGYRPFILTTRLQGEAAEAAKLFGELARGIRASGNPVVPPACLIAGGELTVTVSGKGKGGRCQEFVLAGAREIAGLKGCRVLAFGTDGSDGPTDAAGAIADGMTLRRAWNRGLVLNRYIRRNDSYRFFRSYGGLIVTGPTGTNVNDLYCLFLD